MFAHFSEIAKSVKGFPIMLYNVPSRTASNISAETTLKLAAKFENIVSTKEASGNFSQVMDILKDRPKNFPVFSGDDSSTLPLISLGAQAVFLNETNVLRALASAEFDSRRVVYLPPEFAATVGVINEEKARIVSQRLSAHQIQAEVETDGSAVMVVAQSYYWPWRAYVDGRWTPLFRANHAFQSLVVPAGRHRVELVYQDRKFVAGLAVSGATLLLYLGLWFRKKAHA